MIFDQNVHHFYTGKPDEMMSVFKFRIFEAGSVPADFENKFSVHTFPDHESLNVAEVSRMMIRKTLRGQALYASMVYQGFEFWPRTTRPIWFFFTACPALFDTICDRGVEPTVLRSMVCCKWFHWSSLCPILPILRRQGNRKVRLH